MVKHCPTTPLPPMLCDIPVNVRQHLDPPIGDQYCGFYITEVQTNSEYKTDETKQIQVTTKVELGESTRLWDLARWRIMEENIFYFAAILVLIKESWLWKTLCKVPDSPTEGKAG